MTNETTRIPAERIEEWHVLLARIFPLGGMVTGARERAEEAAPALAAATSALLSEREEMQREIDRLRIEKQAAVEAMKWAEAKLDEERSGRESLLSLLRELVEVDRLNLRRLCTGPGVTCRDEGCRYHHAIEAAAAFLKET